MPFPTLGAAGALDVVVFGPGFGESVVVRTGDDEWFVVDSLKEGGVNPAIELLRLHGATPLFALLTHPHADHCQGFADLLGLSPTTVAACAAPYLVDNPAGRVASRRARVARNQEALTAIVTRDPARQWAPALNGQPPVAFKRTAVTALYPPAGATAANNLNRHATPLRVVFGGTTVLLGADLARASWVDLSGREVPVIHHGLKVPHHGSDREHHVSWMGGARGALLARDSVEERRASPPGTRGERRHAQDAPASRTGSRQLPRAEGYRGDDAREGTSSDQSKGGEGPEGDARRCDSRFWARG